MAFSPLGQGGSTSKTKRRTTKAPSSTLDLQSFQVLQELARKNELGAQEEAEAKPKKLSFLQRLGRGLSALEPANAFYQANYEGKNFVTTYLKDVFQEAGSAITGRELRSETKKTFKNILVREGMKDREGKIDLADVLGLAGDILTDPSTYVGGAIAKGIGKGAKGTAKIVGKVGDKVAPRATAVVRASFDAAKDAAGKAFVYGYGSSKFAKKAGVQTLKQGDKAILKDFIPVFRGGDEAIDVTRGASKGISVAKTKEIAERFTNPDNPIVSKAFLPKTAKVLNFQDVPKELADDYLVNAQKLADVNVNIGSSDFSKLQKSVIEKQNKIVEFARKNNFDAIDIPFEEELRIIKPSVLKTESEVLKAAGGTTKLHTYIDEALKAGSPEEFAKRVTKEELDGVDPIKFFNEYLEPRVLADEVSALTNKVATMATKTGRQYGQMFKALPKSSQDDLVDGLITLRKKFAGEREALIATGKSFEDATRELVEKFDKVEPEKLFKEKETIKFFSNTLLPELQKQKSKIVNATDIGEDMLMQYYFPMIKKNVMTDLNRTLRVSKEGYLKRLKGTMDKADMLTDAPSAYAQRAFQVEKDIMTKDALYDWVGRFGKPASAFKNADEAAAAGYRLVKEKGMYGKDVGYLLENDHKFISELYDPSFKAIEDLAQATGFDWLTSLFKKSVTGLFVPFHVRNFASGILQNYQVLGRAALRPDNIALGQKLATKALSTVDLTDETIDIGKHAFKADELIQPFRDHFGVSSQYISDFGIESLEKLVKASQKSMKVGGQQIPLGVFETPRWVGNYIETQQKMTAYVTALRKGHDIPTALKLSEKAGFDYSKLAPFEKQVMRRLIPFYSFSRKNLELQLKTLAEKPQRLGTLLKYGRAAGTPQSTETGETKMPDWMRNRITINIGQSQAGLPQVISGLGLPIEETSDLADDGLMGALSRLNPLIKVPLEKATGKDFFREQDLKDVYSAKEYSHAPQIIKDFLEIKEVEQEIYKDGEATGKKKKTYVADPERLHIARNLFTSRGFAYLDTLFGEEELTDTGRILKSLTGAKPYEIDETTIEYFENRDNIRALTDMLKRYGVVSTFERSFIPKDEQEETPARRVLKKTKSGEVKRRETP